MLVLALCLVINVAWDEAYLPTKWHLHPEMGRKFGGAPSFLWGEFGSI